MRREADREAGSAPGAGARLLGAEDGVEGLPSHQRVARVVDDLILLVAGGRRRGLEPATGAPSVLNWYMSGPGKAEVDGRARRRWKWSWS